MASVWLLCKFIIPPFRLHWIVDYITSPGIIIPTLVLLILTIWYFYSLTSMLR